jgi:signal peptidase I
MGDNRPDSSDSRSWGPVQGTSIVGQAFFVYFPLKDFGALP